jgi:hypothetical protein
MAMALKLVYKGALYLDKGASDKAESTWRQAVLVDPQCYSAWSFLTDLLSEQKRIEEAIPCLERLIATAPRTAENLYAFADKSCLFEKYDQARALAAEALRLPLSPALQTKLQLTMMRLDFERQEYLSAIRGATRVMEGYGQAPPGQIGDGDYLEALKWRERCYNILSYVAEDVADCRSLLELEPSARIYRHLLFHLNYLPDTTPELLCEESRRFNMMYVTPVAGEIRPHTNNPDPDRRLKIGYISPDFRNHAIIKLLPVVIEHHDRTRFEVFAYSIDTRNDSLTEYVRSWVPNFVELPSSANPEKAGLHIPEHGEKSPHETYESSYVEAIADRVRADGIDILVDLASHTMPLGAYRALGLKPAPVQVTWLGVMATTGLSTMDYFLGNAQIPAPGTEHAFTEKIYRLPGAHACYRPPDNQRELAPAPYFSNQFITFGCFNSQKKITRTMVKVWSVILHLHPGSKLFFKYKDLDKPYAQQHLRTWFAEDGITSARLQFEGISKLPDYLPSWNQVDIALDPFPYTGGTTTFDALWMGVPVVSLTGRLTVSSTSSALAEIGFPVANSLEQYISIAAQLAKAIPAEPGLRRRVRNALLNSRLMDEPRLARELEDAYREIWRRWCATQTGSAPDC